MTKMLMITLNWNNSKADISIKMKTQRRNVTIVSILGT